MKKLLLILLVLFVAACKPQPKNIGKLPNDAVILAFGDSLTYGTGVSDGNDYPSILAGLTHREVLNQGVPGEISADGLKRLPALLDEVKPKLLILIHGGNDILKKIPEQETIANIDTMLSEAKKRQVPVVMMGVPKPGLFLMESAPLYQTLAQREDITIDLDTLPRILGDNNLKSDMVHPNAAGYQQMADRLFKLLAEAGAL